MRNVLLLNTAPYPSFARMGVSLPPTPPEEERRRTPPTGSPEGGESLRLTVCGYKLDTQDASSVPDYFIIVFSQSGVILVFFFLNKIDKETKTT